MTLEERYAWIRVRMNFQEMDSALRKIANDGFQRLVRRFRDLQIEVGADAAFSSLDAHRHPRFGLSIVLPDRPPLIWINLKKHNSAAELVDTMVHESIHATSAIISRHEILPEPENERSYLGEEICALVGANKLLNAIQFPAEHQISRNLDILHNHSRHLRRLGCDRRFIREREFEGRSAAEFLLGGV
jgi:hypothetical protein